MNCCVGRIQLFPCVERETGPVARTPGDRLDNGSSRGCLGKTVLLWTSGRGDRINRQVVESVAIFDDFLNWVQKNKAPDSYRWYRDLLQKFIETRTMRR